MSNKLPDSRYAALDAQSAKEQSELADEITELEKTVGGFEQIQKSANEVALTAEELEELHKKEERKDRLHQNYLRRKANGKQREYEERTKSEKRKKNGGKESHPSCRGHGKGYVYPHRQFAAFRTTMSR